MSNKTNESSKTNLIHRDKEAIKRAMLNNNLVEAKRIFSYSDIETYDFVSIFIDVFYHQYELMRTMKNDEFQTFMQKRLKKKGLKYVLAP